MAILCLAAAHPAPAGAAAGEIDWSKATTIVVGMVEYRFIPDHLTLRRGVPYRLRFENRGDELHEFTAPQFLAGAELRPGAPLGAGGDVVVKPGERKDLDLVPRRRGQFPIACADHDWAGMTGEIAVE